MDTEEETFFFNRIISWWASSSAADAGYHVTLLKAMIRSCTATAVQWNNEAVFVFLQDKFWSNEQPVLLKLSCINKTITSIQCSACCMGGTGEDMRSLMPLVLQWRCYHSYFLFLHLLGNKNLAAEFFFFHNACYTVKMYFDFPMQTEDVIATLATKFAICSYNREKEKKEEKQELENREHNGNDGKHDATLEQQQEKDAKICGICFEPCMDTFFSWRCVSGHSELFHGDCIVKWFERELKCPLCRKNYSVLELFILKTKQIVTRDLKIFSDDFSITSFASGRSANEAIDLT
jgi:hypothetical protein